MEAKAGYTEITSAADALSRRDAKCHAITVCVPEWLEDVKLSYVQDTDSDKLLRKLAKGNGLPLTHTIHYKDHAFWHYILPSRL